MLCIYICVCVYSSLHSKVFISGEGKGDGLTAVNVFAFSTALAVWKGDGLTAVNVFAFSTALAVWKGDGLTAVNVFAFSTALAALEHCLALGISNTYHSAPSTGQSIIQWSESKIIRNHHCDVNPLPPPHPHVNSPSPTQYCFLASLDQL